MRSVWCIFLLFIAQLNGEVQELKYEVLEEIERKKKGFTQGLFISDGKLYESTGGYGSSLIRRMDLKTQEVELSKNLPETLFGEGLASYGEDQMIQLTWRKGLGIIYDREKMNIVKTFRYGTEGWGVATLGKQVVMSDGSSTLYFLDPEKLSVKKELKVTMEGKELKNLNELEWVGDHIYANIWLKDEIVVIESESGKVVARIDCKALFPDRPRHDADAVLNGIAYDPAEETFYLTGKKWAKIFKIKLPPLTEGSPSGE